MDKQGLTLLPFIPVPQDAENHDDEEDGEKSRKPSKVAAALVLISARKTTGHGPAVGGWVRVGEQARFRSESPGIWNRSQVGWKEAKLGWEIGHGRRDLPL